MFCMMKHAGQKFCIVLYTPLSHLKVMDLECRPTVESVLSGMSKKKTKIGFQDRILLNAGQKYCRMLQREHSAILSTFIKLPFVIKIYVLSIFEWPLKSGFTV